MAWGICRANKCKQRKLNETSEGQMNMERLMEVRWGNRACRRHLYGRKVELHHRDWSQVKQISVKILEFLGGAKSDFLTDTFHSSAPSPSTCSKWISVLLGNEDFFFSPSTCASVYCNVWEWLHQPWESSGISVYLGSLSGKISQVMALNRLSCHIPCVQPGATPGILDGSSRATIYHHLYH